MPETADAIDDAGLRRAAILLMTLPPKTAAPVLSKLPPRLIEQISIQIAQIESVSGDEQEVVMAQFLTSKASAVYASPGGLERAKELIRMAMGRDASGMLGNVQQAIESMPFGFLKKVDPQTLLQFINEEHPQTVALLISHMPTAYGAELLAGMGPERQLDVVRRISQMRRPSPEAVKEMETGLELRLSNMMNQQQTEVGGVANVAGILNVSERSIERSILDVLSREDPELSEEIRRLMFVFEDLVHLTDRDTQTLLKHVETSQWAMGLKGASDALKQKVLRNMSRRAAENLRDEIDFLGSVRITEVERVQQRIVDIVRHLEDAGEVTRSVDEQTEYVS